MPQMRIIGRGQYSTCRRGMFLRQIGRFCGRVGTRKALREVFSANASFIIPYVSVALLALLCVLGGMKRVAWCFGAGVLDLWRRCDFWVGTCATRERLCPFPGAGSPLFHTCASRWLHLRRHMVIPAPVDGYTSTKGRVWRTGNSRCTVNAPWRKSCRGASICVSLREPLSNSVL